MNFSPDMTAPMKVLLTAKAPVPGQAKTRLAAAVGAYAAADLAALALLDTIAAVNEIGPGHLALAGDLVEGLRSDEIHDHLSGWTITRQRGDGFAERLAHAHARAGHGPVVQIGMDTPQVTSTQLRNVAATLTSYDVVVAPATDGGWWALARTNPEAAQCLAQVSMSQDDTYAQTVKALQQQGISVGTAEALVDVDTAADATIVAAEAPYTRFAQAWHALQVGAR